MTSRSVLDPTDGRMSDVQEALSQMAALLRVSADTMRQLAEIYGLDDRDVALSAADDADRAAEKLETYAKAPAAPELDHFAPGWADIGLIRRH